MASRISILGSTGSIGESTLKIVRTHPKKFRVLALAAKKNVKKLAEQALEFQPKVVCIYDEKLTGDLKALLGNSKIKIVTGIEGLEEIATLEEVDRIVVALVGAIGLRPIFKALEKGKNLAIANKEPLVVAGRQVMELAEETGSRIFPIDSEHSGLWQCLQNQQPESLKRLILTSSGGPFRKYRGSLKNIKPSQALNHPKWKMGAKITIDSATLMNKGLEVIEASNLFGVDVRHVDVLIHPEAVIHALIELVDGTYMANLGITDMRLPIQYALSFPDRLNNHLPTLDLAQIGKFHFDKPDVKKFPCLELGYEASKIGGTMPCVLNASNEIAVEAFLNGKIGFLDIAKTICKVMKKHSLIRNPDLNVLLETDEWARQEAAGLL